MSNQTAVCKKEGGVYVRGKELVSKTFGILKQLIMYPYDTGRALRPITFKWCWKITTFI